MTRLFMEGGIVYMIILTLLVLLIVGLSVFFGISIFRSTGSPEKAKDLISLIKSVALFTLSFAVLSQVLKFNIKK